MTVDGPAAAVRAAVAALNDGDLDGYLQYFDPAGPRWVMGLTEPLPLDAVADGFRHLAAGFSSLHLREEDLFATDARVCGRWRLEGIHSGDYYGLPATGRALDVPSCEVYAVEDGRVREVWTYQDPTAVFSQIQEGA